VAMAGRAFDLVFSLEHFLVGGVQEFSACALLEELGCGAASEAAGGIVGWIYFAVFFPDLRIAHGILQLWGMAGDRNAAGDRTGAGGRTWRAMVDTHARSIGGSRSLARGRADYDACDFRKSAGAWGHLFLAGTAAAGHVSSFDGAHSGLNAAGVCGAANARGNGSRGVFGGIGSGVGTAECGQTHSGYIDDGSDHGAVLFRGKYGAGSFWTVSFIKTLSGESAATNTEGRRARDLRGI